MSEIGAFMARVEVSEDGCWLWKGAGHSGGYGIFYFDRGRSFAHRWAYEHFVGPIGAGLTIDHVCHNADDQCAGGIGCEHRRCVNPAHLEAVSRGENTLRGKSSSATRARQTHCREGHPLSGRNLIVDPKTGHRRCRCCKKKYNEASIERHRESARLYARRRYAQKKLERERAAA